MTVVYRSPDGLGPVDIFEALARQFDMETSTKRILQVAQANPKLFVETGVGN